MAIVTAAVSHLILLIPKLHFEAKTRSHAFLVPTNRSTYFFNVIEVSEFFWTVPGQSGAELAIFICP